MATLTSTADGRVPDWIEGNAQLFRRSREAGASDMRAGLVESDPDDGGEEKYRAACMAAMLVNTEQGVGWIEVPASNPLPASFFRDVSNHPNILATFLYTARARAGFLPNVMGQQLSPEQWADYTSKFNAWLNQLDAFWFYVTLINQEAESIVNPAATSGAIVDALSKFVLQSSNEAEEEVTQRIRTSFELASEYMVEKNITSDSTTSSTQVVQAAFQHEAFYAVGPSNPIARISFTSTTLSKNEQNAIGYDATLMNRFTFRLNSASIIANAEALASGSTIVSTKVYTDYINALLDEWAENRETAPNTSY